jgi:hypothetical protein
MAGDWNQVWEQFNGPSSTRSDILIAKINCGDERVIIFLHIFV